MAKSEGTNEIEVTSGRWKARIPAAAVTVAVTAALGALGLGGFQTLRGSHSGGAGMTDAREFVALETRFDTHMTQQLSDYQAQKSRDDRQELDLKNTDGEIEMFNLSLARMETKQDVQSAQITDMQRDIKELLRRQGMRTGGPP